MENNYLTKIYENIKKTYTNIQEFFLEKKKSLTSLLQSSEKEKFSPDEEKALIDVVGFINEENIRSGNF
jgi:hypothetical protein